MLSANEDYARRLREVADLLREQDGNPFRVKAYRDAARGIDELDQPLADLVERDDESLRDRLHVGERLERTIRVLVRTGRIPLLDRLRGGIDPEALLASVPGIGKTWAGRLHEEFAIETLEDLETAALNGTLAAAGFGPKRLSAIRDTLANRLGRVRDRRTVAAPRPPVAEILDVDREYRERAASGLLRRIAPKRLNPTGAAWLPILHTQRGGRHYTALYSNTARAHQLGKTNDWVVVYLDQPGAERQWTVVTATRGALVGQRVVRGRETECGAGEPAHRAG
ncbi:MAG: hypothetical protein SFV51_12855 [Bryobacteraceae bacterium]|nr:hypothetical protein [Bryobacteraceae bacterium]